MAEEYADARDWLSRLHASEHLDHVHTAPSFGVLFADAHRLHSEASISRAIRRCVSRVAEAIAGVLRRGQAEGSIREDASPASLSWLVVSLIQVREFRRTHIAAPSSALEKDLQACILETLRPPSPCLV